MYTCEHMYVQPWELMYVFERTNDFKNLSMKSAFGILRQWVKKFHFLYVRYSTQSKMPIELFST